MSLLQRQACAVLRTRCGDSTGTAARAVITGRSLTSDARRLVLGIESSCDDSCASLVSAPHDYANQPGIGQCTATIHNSVVYKQDHGTTRGIQPLFAAHGHSAHVPLAIRDALHQGQQDGVIKDARFPEEIDAIAVTQGPGMAGCLAQGLSNAKLCSSLWNKPLLYIHHMVAHALTPFMTQAQGSVAQHQSPSREPLRFPFLVFLLSGGHTQLVLCSSPTEYRILADCGDNSIGNAFDRVARTLNVPFVWGTTAPGAALEAFACPPRENHPADIPIVRASDLPVSFRKRPKFSYSGLIYMVQKHMDQASPEVAESKLYRSTLAHAFQQAAFGQIQDKLSLALEGNMPGLSSSEASQIQDIVVSGGVASNGMLRAALQETLDKVAKSRGEQCDDSSAYQLHSPPISLCTDNAAMIAHAGLLLWEPTFSLTASPRAKWSLDAFSRREQENKQVERRDTAR